MNNLVSLKIKSGLFSLAAFTGSSQVQDYSYIDYGFCHFYLEHQNTAKDEEFFQYFIIIFFTKEIIFHFFKDVSYFLSSPRNFLLRLANFSTTRVMHKEKPR